MTDSADASRSAASAKPSRLSDRKKRFVRLLRGLATWPATIALLALGGAIRALSPLMTVKFLAMKGERIGHMVGEFDAYFAEKEAVPPRPRTLELFYYDTPPCNLMADAMMRRRAWISASFRRLHWAVRQWPGAEAHLAERPPVPAYVDMRSGRPPVLSFSAAEEAQAAAALKAQIGDVDRPIVCIFNRDPAYLLGHMPDFDNTYHDYRDSRIGAMAPAVEYLQAEGYRVIRMGAAALEPLPVTLDHVHDYAASDWRTPLLDLYIFSRSAFFLAGGTSGICDIARMFRKPIAHVNSTPLDNFVGAAAPDEILIPKLYRQRGADAPMTIAEIDASGARAFYLTQEFSAAGVELLENDPDEILEMAKEMVARHRGVWAPDAQDEARQDAFFARLGIDRTRHPRIGTAFLRKHEALYA